ncbi:MAG: DUF6452 family protein [Bacteroides sp.]|nr:DUF6452 family protein [Bacteroides sp.]
MKKLIPLALILITFYPVCSILLSACSDNENCSLEGRQMVNCTFKTRNSNNTAFVNDTLDSLTVTAIGTDSIIINRQQSVHKISLPLRYTNDSTILIFHYTRYLRDTVIFSHTNTPYFLSMECGYEMRQALKGVYVSPSQMMDSLSVTNTQATTNESTENIVFYMY